MKTAILLSVVGLLCACSPTNKDEADSETTYFVDLADSVPTLVSERAIFDTESIYGSPEKAALQTVIYDPSLNELTFDRSDVILGGHLKNREGRFPPQYQSLIAREDSPFVFQNSQVMSLRHRLPFANAQWEQDTLTLTIWDSSPSHEEWLSLKILDGRLVDTRYRWYPYPFAIHTYTSLVKQVLSLNAPTQRNQPIKGTLDLTMVEERDFSDHALEEIRSDKKDTVIKRISGPFVIIP